MSDPVIVQLTTVSSEDEAEKLARALVERRLAACVNVVPGVRSFYRWQGEVQCDAEVLLVIKTARARLGELRSAVRALHSYDLPEQLDLEVTGGDRDYLEWVLREAGGAPEK